MVMALHRCKHDMLSRRDSRKKWRPRMVSASPEARLLRAILSAFIFKGTKKRFTQPFGEFNEHSLYH